MGAWGDNNFENDLALDVLAALINSIVKNIREIYSGANNDAEALVILGNYQIAANIDILATLFDHYDIFPDFEFSEVESWKQILAIAFQDVRDRFEPFSQGDSDDARKEIVEKTFDRLLNVLNTKYSDET
jgi:hypothetical protein